VDASYTLSVRDTRMQAVSVRAKRAADGSEEQFYGNILVDLTPVH
jgi:hypothetical protein